MTIEKVLDRRRAGILLHPTSLPGPGAVGDLGDAAYRFVDYLEAGGFTIWQMLPLGPTHSDRSPYSAKSVLAGNPELISYERLAERDWISADAVDRFAHSAIGREGLAQEMAERFTRDAPSSQVIAYERFCDVHAHWLDDYALFAVIRDQHDHREWTAWPVDLRDRSDAALGHMRNVHKTQYDGLLFEQFLFYLQLLELRAYARGRNVMLFGDMPLFVAQDSADVWAGRRYFRMETDGSPEVVAGVPPDYFSATGQRWGNPLYNWQAIEADGFKWWKQRARMLRLQADVVRIDHFRGLAACWEIPADAEGATVGRWCESPGQQLLEALTAEFPQLELVAEDLGTITPDVYELRDRFSLPGMNVLQFAFDGSPHNPHLPVHHRPASVVYTGTHDNDTTAGWAATLDEHQQHLVREMLSCGDPITDCIMNAAIHSASTLAVLPMQDVLRLGTEARMNVPGTDNGNWSWRLDDIGQIDADNAAAWRVRLGAAGRLAH